MTPKFELCENTDFYLRMGLVGPSGSGKTYTALKLATEFGCERIGVIDTESRSARRYAKSFPKRFYSLELERFSPTDYIDAIVAAQQAGIEFLVIDSLSHAWIGKGGVLELVDLTARRQAKGGTPNSFAAWREVTPEHNRLVDTLLHVPMHLLVTMRAKTEYIVEQDGRGKSVPKKVGLAPVQREGLEYEFDIIGELSQEHELIITKTRCPSLSGNVIPLPGAELAQTLRGWVSPPIGQASSSWTERIDRAGTLAELDAIRNELNQKRLAGAKLNKEQARSVRNALEAAQARLEPQLSEAA